jgi:hypothetical protein
MGIVKTWYEQLMKEIEKDSADEFLKHVVKYEQRL